MHKGVSRPDGRSGYRPKGCGRGKSGLHRHTVPDNIRRGRPQGQCHRERTARLRPSGRRRARVKRCGKSAPRVRQRNRHGKPHREQDRIGTATRDRSLQSDNTAGRCQARRPGRLLEATCKHCPRGMAVTYRPRKRAVPYRTRLTGRLMSLKMRGSAQHAGPLAILTTVIPGRRKASNSGMTSTVIARASLAMRRSLSAGLSERRQRFGASAVYVRANGWRRSRNSASPARSWRAWQTARTCRRA